MSITIWRINPQVNGDRRNAFIGSCDSVGFWLNFRPHFVKIHKLLSFAVKEFSIFYTEGQRGMYKTWVETEGMKRMNGEKRNLNLRDGQHTACLARGSVTERPCAEQWWKKIGMCEHRTGYSPAILLTSCKMRGLRVTMPDPRGRKSLSERDKWDKRNKNKETPEMWRIKEMGGKFMHKNRPGKNGADIQSNKKTTYFIKTK